MAKRILAITICLLFAFSMVTFAATKFSDVTSNYSWAEEAINALAQDGVIAGYPDGTFKPGKDITKEEAITLFARMLGSNEKVNESVVSLSSLIYEEELESYNTYAKDAAAYLMYKKVLTAADLVTYLSSTNKGETLKRYEAATLIAKCLGGDIWLKTNPEVTLSYADTSSIPSAAKGYVYFASEAGIIQGMEENKFVPMGDVTRAQIAVMIHRMVVRMDYTYAEGVISNVDTVAMTMTIRNADGDSEIYSVGNTVAVMLDGEQAKLSDLSVGQEVIITFSNEALYSLDVVEMPVDESFEAIYKGKLSDNSQTKVKFTPLDSDKTLTYALADDVVVSYNGGKGNLSNVSVGDYVKVSVSAGKVVIFEAESKNTTIEGARVTAIEFVPDVLITVETKSGDLESYPVKSGATIRRNSAVTTFKDLLVGDKVDITLEYGKISSVVAIGVTKNITGTIEEITISKANSYITIASNGGSTKYSLSRDLGITLDGAPATIYDLRLGFDVEIEATSATITKITVKSVAAPMQITGQIKLVNTTYNMLVVTHTDANGNTVDTQVFAKDNVKILDSNDGKIKYLRDLKPGQNVTAAGAENVGIFEANSIMILTNTN
ncbi:MAG: S-layer homology domain-containing protein [Ruminococcaceae bacterium]|nr:S-layer homology domain-containing protein [Oscillospiraceae bacterium]